MQPFISPLDPHYISLKRAATLIAEDHSGVDSDDIMDLLKYALFNEEFEAPQTAVRVSSNAETWNLPLIRLEAPLRGCTRPPVPAQAQPQEYFAVKAATIAEVLLERNALPGSMEDWATYAEFPRSPEPVEELHYLLSRIPYRSFHPRSCPREWCSSCG